MMVLTFDLTDDFVAIETYQTDCSMIRLEIFGKVLLFFRFVRDLRLFFVFPSLPRFYDCFFSSAELIGESSLNENIEAVRCSDAAIYFIVGCETKILNSGLELHKILFFDSVDFTNVIYYSTDIFRFDDLIKRLVLAYKWRFHR